jgi:recombinational DNA repair ATPase RecF
VRIHRLTLRDFRGVADRTVELSSSGVTIVQGDNEAGKTSLVEALDLLLDYRDDSTAQVVRAVKRADADVGAYVEAELSAGPYRLTYAKRFHRDRSTTLTVHEPAAEQRTGREAHERVNAILDAHVDRQLWAALRLHQGVELDQADLSEGTSLAAALDTVAGTGLGGDRESSVYDRVTAEYERFFTLRAGRPTKLLADAGRREEEAQAAADDLSGELDALDADVERDGVLVRRIAEQREALAAQRAQADALDARAGALERRAGEVERLRLTSELAEAALLRARAIREARGVLVAELAAAESRVVAAQADVATLAADVAAHEQEADAFATRAAAADASHARARAALDEAAAAREALLLHDQLDALTDRLERARAAQDELRQADAALEAHAIDDQALDAIETAERAVGGAAAALEADASAVVVRALDATTVTVDDAAPVALGAGDTVAERVADVLRVRIGALAEVVVTGGGHARERAERHARAVAALADRCAHAGVADPGAARDAHRRRQSALRSATGARAQLDAALGDATLDVLTDRAERLRERIGGAPRGAVADADAAEDAVRDARKATAEAEGVAADAARALRAAQDTLADRRADAQRRQRELDGARARRAELAPALAAARAEASDQTLVAAVGEHEAEALGARLAHGQAATSLEGADPVLARADADAAAAVVDRLSEELRSAEDERRDVRSRLELRGEQGLHDAFESARRTLEHAERAHARLRAQADAARLLYERMTAHRDTARRAYAAPLRDKLERLGTIVFGAGLRVELDDDLRIARRTLDGVTLDYDQLSSGAREQLAVLARLAVAGIVGRDGGVPLILDDALGYSDPTRLEKLGAALRVGAKQTQVIVLTCVPERYRHVGQATVVHL